MIKCKVNLCNIASVQYNYFRMITSKNWLKRILNITFLKKITISSLPLRFSALVFIFVSISKQKKIKLLAITSETRKYLIHSNHHSLNLTFKSIRIQDRFIKLDSFKFRFL